MPPRAEVPALVLADATLAQALAWDHVVPLIVAGLKRADLARVVGQGASVDLLVEDLAADLEGRAFEIAQVAGGWMFRTRAAYAPAIRAAG